MKSPLEDKKVEKTMKWMEDISVLKARCKNCNKLETCDKMLRKGFFIVFRDGSNTLGCQEYFYFCDYNKNLKEDEVKKVQECYLSYLENERPIPRPCEEIRHHEWDSFCLVL